MTSPATTFSTYQGRPEKARKARVKVDLLVEIQGAKDQATGHLRNLTLGGCRILSPCAFPVREVLRVILPGTGTGPDLPLEAELRWLGLNPTEGPFDLGCRFLHSGDTAARVETLLRSLMKQGAAGGARRPDPARPQASRPGGRPASGALRLVFATEGIGRLLSLDPSAPPPGSPGVPRGESGRP